MIREVWKNDNESTFCLLRLVQQIPDGGRVATKDCSRATRGLEASWGLRGMKCVEYTVQYRMLLNIQETTLSSDDKVIRAEEVFHNRSA